MKTRNIKLTCAIIFIVLTFPVFPLVMLVGGMIDGDFLSAYKSILDFDSD